MCYDIAYFTKKIEKYEQRFGVEYGESEVIPMFHTSGFSHSEVPVVTHDQPNRIEMFTWGLIPFWVKDLQSAAKIQNRTLNARDNTMFEKPSFRAAAQSRRCLVLVDGFFDHHWKEGKSYPFFIEMKNKEPFALGGLWEKWGSDENPRYTVSIVTTEPNKTLAYIHNKPAVSETARMPFIVRQEFERNWMDPTCTPEEVQQMILPFSDDELTTYNVPRLRGKSYPGNVPKMIQPVHYEELENSQGSLF